MSSFSSSASSSEFSTGYSVILVTIVFAVIENSLVVDAVLPSTWKNTFSPPVASKYSV